MLSLSLPPSLPPSLSELAEVSLGDSHSFQVHQVYDDKDIHSLLKAASDVLGKGPSA